MLIFAHFARRPPSVTRPSIPALLLSRNYIVMYARDKSNHWKPNRVFTKRGRDNRYSSFIENFEDDYPNWRLIPLLRAFSATSNETSSEKKRRLGDQYDNALDEFVLENADRVVQPVPPAYDGVGQETRKMIDISLNNPNTTYIVKLGRAFLIFTFVTVSAGFFIETNSKKSMVSWFQASRSQISGTIFVQITFTMKVV